MHAIASPLRAPLWAPLLIAVVPFCLLLALVLWTTHGQFTYTLDDPYIHLALARNLAHGHYGINPLEASAPSSSILWPLLLAPFAYLGRAFEYAPLAINALCLLGLAVVVDRVLADIRPALRWTLVFLVLFSLNAYGLVFTGMEHSLQILLVGFVLLGLQWRDRLDVPPWHSKALLAIGLVMLPLVRYEGLAISVPVIGYLFFTGERRLPAVLLALIAAGVGGFSLFLEHEGLGWLPTSVLAKSSFGTLSGIAANTIGNLRNYGFLLVPVVLLLAYFRSRDPFWAVALAGVAALHFLLGRYGWYGRYEVYFAILVVLVSLRVTATVAPRWLPAFLLLPFCFGSLVYASISTPLAAANILGQQAQMAQIARLLDAPVAVNDLGLVALRSGHYVLDLQGLGSLEALRARRARLDRRRWISDLMQRKGVEYAFVYDSWVPQRPASWIKVGELELAPPVITPADDVVSLYASNDAARRHLEQVLREYQAQAAGAGYRLVLSGTAPQSLAPPSR